MSPPLRYLDHNATTPPRPEVTAKVLAWLEEGFGNASSVHHAGRAARAAVDRARAQVARFLGASPSEIVFTSGGSESDALALAGVLHAGEKGTMPARRHLVISAIEHPAVLRTADALGRQGFDVSRVTPRGDGVVAAADVIAAVRQDTKLVSMMLANNETGALQPVAEVARVLRPRGVLVHTDAVQAAGKVAIDAGLLGVDLLSISGHKLGALQGAGALYVRRGVAIEPLVHGGNQERGRRAGTENVLGSASLGLAAELAQGELGHEPARLARLRDRLERTLLERVPGVRVHAAGAPRLCNTTSLAFAGLEGEALLLNLDLAGIAASSGSACSSGTMAPSHVLLAMGESPEEAHGSLRLSLGHTSTDEDIDAAIEALVEIAARLRSLPMRAYPLELAASGPHGARP